MELSSQVQIGEHDYQLLYKNERRKRAVNTQILGIGRHVIGRVSHSDFQIKSRKISAIHAVLEITEDKVLIYDMNSTNHTFVNGKKTIYSQVRADDIISFAGIDFILKKLDATKDALPQEAPAYTPKTIIGHPLATNMPSFDESEYIFEDQEDIYPIFEYKNQNSLEVSVIHNERVVSIDYIDPRQKNIMLTGNENHESATHIFFSYLHGEKEHLFIHKDNDHYKLHNLDGFSVSKLTKIGVKQLSNHEVHEAIEFELDDLLCLQKENIEIYLRFSHAPPVIEQPPIFRQDAFVHRYVIPTLLTIFIPLLILSFLTIEKEEEPEKKIERIATIIFNKKIDGKVKAKSPKSNQGLKSTTKEKRDENQKGKLTKGKNSKLIKINKPSSQNQITKKVKAQKNTKKVSQSKSKAKSSKVKGFKNLDFTSSLNKLLVSQNQLGKTQAGSQQDSDSLDNLKLNDSGESTLKQIGTSGDSSVFEGASENVSTDIGAEGLSDKKSRYTIGLAGNDVVRGSVNGSDVREKLNQHRSQIRHCVEVNKRPGEDTNGIMPLRFKIAASGYVPKNGVYIPTKQYNNATKKCVGNVLRGIQFTPPVDGSTSSQNFTLDLRDI